MVNQSIGGGHMHGNDIWIALFRKLPGDLQDALALGLTTGAEIITQRIIKLESEFMVTRGRLAGTTDPGRLLMIPYAQLTYVSITRVLTETEIEQLFGKVDPGPTSAAAQSAAATAEPATVKETTPGVNAPKKQDAPSKTVLLAKLRDRLKDGPLTKK